MAKNTARKQARRRLFHIWQETGTIPFHKEVQKEKKSGSAFFKGSFDSIPFVNEDSKRTFVHLLLRPGYMIRDYLRGKQDIYLAPMTSLLVFYAFFSLICSVVTPERKSLVEIDVDDNEVIVELENNKNYEENLHKMLVFVSDVYTISHLDLFPDRADTKAKQSLANLEATLRSQGINEFMGTFLVLWFAVWLATRRRFGFSFSAAATASAYILCQYSFYRLFVLLITFGRTTSLGLVIIMAVMIFNYCQLFGISRRGSLRLTMLTGVYMALAYALLIGLAALLLIGFFFI